MNTTLHTRLAAIAAACTATLAILVGMNAMFASLPGAAPADAGAAQLAATQAPATAVRGA
jgi:hypothetical protein